MFFVGYRTFTARPEELPHANINEKKAADRPRASLAEARVNPDTARRRTAAVIDQTQGRNCRKEPVRQETDQAEKESRFSPPGQELASWVSSEQILRVC